jgi:hypothetical protein
LLFYVDTLSTIKNNHLVRLTLYLEKIQVNTDYLVNSQKDLPQLIIDCSASNLINSQYRKDVDTICRDIIYALACEKSRTTLRVKSCCWSCFYINETLRPVIRALFLMFKIPHDNDF